jgi:hypothetical protein
MEQPPRTDLLLHSTEYFVWNRSFYFREGADEITEQAESPLDEAERQQVLSRFTVHVLRT